MIQVARGTNWFTGGLGYSNTPGFSGTVALTVGTLYHFKIQAFTAYGATTLYLYYSTDGTTWLIPQAYSKTSFATPAYPVSVGPVFLETHGGSGWTSTTGIHIGSLSIGEIVLASPTSSVSKAYVSTSGESIALFFKDSNNTQVSPRFMMSVPTIYKNGTSMGDLSSLVPWVDSTAAVMIFPLPSPVVSTDVITMSAADSWMLLSDQSTVHSISGLSVTNNVGKSCFGTDTLARTLKVGVNLSSVGCMYSSSDNGQAFNNLAVRCRFGTGSGLPKVLASTPLVFGFMTTGTVQASIPASFGSPGPVGYFALGYDDNYVANGGSPTPQLRIISHSLPSVVTQVTSCDNHGTNGIGQYYLFQVTSTGKDGAGHPAFGTYLDLVYPAGSGNTYVSNLFILAPGEFDFTIGTPLTFDRSNPLVVSKSLKAVLPGGVGSMRFADAFNYLTQAVDPWECRGENDASWNENNFVTQLTVTQMRPLVTSNSPYIYGELFGSMWTASSSPLASSMNSSQTTITLANAQSECNGNPLFYGLNLAVGGQGGPGTLEYMRVISVSGTSVTVVRGWAFNGVSTPAVSHGIGEKVNIGNRASWTNLASLGLFFSGPGHQTAEIVCAAPHLLHTGQNVGIPFAPTYPVNDTNGNQVGSMNSPLTVMITGPNTFMMSWWNSSKNGYPGATLASTYNFSPPVTYSFGLPGGQMPFGAATVLTNYYNCNIHVNLPMLGSDGFFYDKARTFLSKLTPGRELVVELGDEPGNYYWMQWVGQSFSAFFNTNEQFYFYTNRVKQVNDIFYSVFSAAGRGNEIKRFMDCAGNNNIMTLAQNHVPPIQVDYMGMAPYCIADYSASTTAFNNQATVSQSADLFIHQIYYKPGVSSFNSGVPGSEFSAQDGILATYHNLTGYTCKIYGYEAGYQSGSSYISYGPLSRNGWFNYWLSSDIRYLPVWRIYEKDFYAMCQVGGYTTLNLYSLYLYPYGPNQWNVVSCFTQVPGKGDGSDGKFDNRKVLEVSDLTGPVYKTAGYLGVGAGTVSVVSGGTTVTFSQAWTITPGLSWITIDEDPYRRQCFLISGSGVGPWTIYMGVSQPSPTNYGGPTNSAANYVYGIATNQDANSVSVRAQALAEWNSSGGNTSNNWILLASTGIG